MREAPRNLDAERGVLSSMLQDQEAVDEAAEKLKPEDFFDALHKQIFAAMLKLNSKKKAVELLNVADQMEKDGIDVDVQYLGEIAVTATSSVYAKEYIDLVAEASKRRKYIEISERLAEAAYSGADVTEIAETIQNDVFGQPERGEGGLVSIRDITLDVVEEIEKLYRNGGEITGIPSGFTDLDKKTAGFHPGELIIVGARPAMGKSAFGLNIAQYAAMKKGAKCAVFSLEMSKEQLVSRMLSNYSATESQKIRTGQLNDDDWQKVAEAMGPLSDAPIFIDDTAGLSVGEIRNRCRKMKQKDGLDLVIIDYLQLISGGARASESRQMEISEISRNLKCLARELECPVIALSQLSRTLETRPDKKPKLSDLRESGSIEQDADLVMFLYRDEYYHPDTEDKNIAEVIIAKQRNGSTGTVRLLFMGDYTRFANLMEER